MRKIVPAAFAAAVLFCLPAWATGEQQTSLNAPGTSRGIGIVNGSTTCGSTALLFTSTGAGTMRLNVSGTLSAGAIAVRAAVDGSTTAGFTGDLMTYPRNTGPGATTITAAGDYDLPVIGDLQMCVYGSSFTGAATVLVSFSPTQSRMIVVTDPSSPLAVAATVNVSGAADLAGNAATFNANNVCSSVLTAGLQSVGFHMDNGTLAATLTAFGTNNIGAVNCATAGTCTAISTSAGATLVVTNPNGVKDISISALPGMRQVEMCTTSFTGGTAAGVVTGTYLNASSSGGGGGTVIQGAPNTAGNAWPVTQTFSGSLIDPRAIRALTVADIVGAAQSGAWNVGQTGTWTVQPGNTANTTPWLLKIDQTTPGTTNGVVLTQTATVQGAGTAGSPSGGVGTMQGQTGMTPLDIENKPGDILAANAADRFSAATLLNSACSATTACTSVQSIQWAAAGTQSGELTVTANASLVGTAACDKGYDTLNTTYVLASCYFWNGTSRKSTLTTTDLAAGTQWAIYWTGSPSTIRVRLATQSSGSVTVAGRSTLAPGLPFPVEAKPPTQAQVTLTASTSETTLLAAGGSGVFLDLTYLKCSNTSSTASVISVRDATAGTVRDTIVCPAAIQGCEGQVYKVPFAQTSANANWTIQAGTSASSIICTAQAVQR